MRKKLSGALLLGAVSGLSLITAQNANASSINGVNNDIICKRPITTERQLKIHSCATSQYPLAPLAPSVPNIGPGPGPDPTPPYSS